MSKSTTQILGTRDHLIDGVEQVAIVIGASLFVALCARVTIPLPFTPVPLTLQNFGVLLVGLSLGGRRGFAALALYLAEGISGMPVFSPTGPGGIAQLLGPTGGFLLAYPFVAGIAGWVFEKRQRNLRAGFHRQLSRGTLLVCRRPLVARYSYSLRCASHPLRSLLVRVR